MLGLCLSASSGFAQSLDWSVAYHGGDGIPDTSTVGTSSLAVDGAGDVYALSLAFNGTSIGLLVKYSAVGYQSWSRIERDGWPQGLATDGRGWPLVLTPYRTLAYDGAGNLRWRAEHVFEDTYLEGAAIARAPQSGAYVAGRTGPIQLGLMRLDQDGRVSWLRTQRTPRGEVIKQVDALAVDRAGRAYVAGRSQKADDNTVASFFVAAFAPDGSPLWSRSFPSMVPEDLPVLAVDPNGGACLSFPGGAVVDVHTVKLSASGGTLWSSDTIATLTGFGKPSFAAVSEDGGLYVAGLTGNLAFIARHDASGAQRWVDLRPSIVFGGLGVDPSGRAILLSTLPGFKLGAIAYEPSGNVAWSRDQWGDPLDAGASPAGLLVTSTGRVLAVAQGWRLGLSVQFTLAMGPTGHVEFVATPAGVPSADWAWSSRFDADGNALVLATGFDSGYRDRLLKYDRTGAMLWGREPLGGPETGEVVWAFDVGPAGESVVVGTGGTWQGLPRVASFDAGGSLNWTRSDVLPPQYETGGATAVVVDARGAAYVAGWAWDQDMGESHLYLCKYSADGQLLWRRFDVADASVGLPVLLSRVRGDQVAVGGIAWLREEVRSSARIWVVDASGADVWTAMLPDPLDALTTLVADSAGAVLAGTSFPGRVYKFGATGTLEWTRPSPNGNDWVNALAVDADRSVAVAYWGWGVCFLERFTTDGDLVWQKYADYPNGPSYCAALAPRPAGGFFVSGGHLDGLDQDWHGYLAAYDAEGHVDWVRNAGAPGGGRSALNSLVADSSGRVLAAGWAFGGATDYDALAQVVTDEPRAALAFYTVPPCRVVDTRDPALGGPSALAAGAQTEVRIAGKCGVPASARAVAGNITAVTPSSTGHITAFPTGRVAPLASVLNHGAGATRASQATLRLGDGGKLTLRTIQLSGSVHVVIDVAGYFE